MESNTLIRKDLGEAARGKTYRCFSGSVFSAVPVVCQAPVLVAFCLLMHLALAPALSVIPSSMASGILSCNPVISQSLHPDSTASLGCTGPFLVGTASSVRGIRGSRSKDGEWTSFTQPQTSKVVS